MQSKRKSNGIIGHSFKPVNDIKEGIIVFSVANVGEFELNATALQPDVEWAALLHGLVQKVSDRAAIGRDPETGASATPEEKFAAMKECADRLMSGGPWNAVATGGTGSTGGLLFRAMKTLYPNAWSDRVTFAAYIAEKAISESTRLGTKVTETDVRNSLMRVKKIAKAMDELRGPVAQVEVGGMLQELEGKA